MKTLICICALLNLIAFIAIQPSFAQSFGSDNPKWVYDLGNGFDNGIVVIMPSKDTIIAGKPTVKYTRERIVQLSTIDSSFLEPFYISTSNNVVEYSTDKLNFDTLYNFDLNIGDTWSIPERDSNGDTIRLVSKTVVDTFRQTLNGVDVFCQGVRFQNGVIDTLYEYIGSRIEYILPFQHEYFKGNDACFLRCFSNNSIGAIDFRESVIAFYSQFQVVPNYTDFEYECEDPTSISKINKQTYKLEINPNPAIDRVSIKTNKANLNKMIIYDLHGNQIRQHTVDANHEELDISDLQSGVYFLQVADHFVEKIVIVK